MPADDPDFAAARRYLAVNVGRLRARAGWTQQQAAEVVGIDPKHLQKIEYGDLNASLRTLVRLAAAFNVTVGRLLKPTTASPTKRSVGRPPRRSRP